MNTKVREAYKEYECAICGKKIKRGKPFIRIQKARGITIYMMPTHPECVKELSSK